MRVDNMSASKPTPVLRTVMRHVVIDPTPREIDGLKKARDNAAHYLINQGMITRPLNSFSPQEVDDFIRVVVGGYTEGLSESEKSPF